uniref:Uncharacterized protein n=1 Tax=Cannabis sativa TaxID=3483 RepID=A0A803QI60_CANSA
MSKMSSTKFEIEHFDGKNNFNLWQSTVKGVLLQQGLLKSLQGKKLESMIGEVHEELQAKTECFDTYKTYDGRTVLIDNESSSKIVGIRTVKEKMFDGVL